MHSWAMIVVGTFLLGAVAGCGSSDRHTLGEVTGTVTYEGKPLSEGTIVFEVPGSRPASGKIEAGQITEVTTYEPGDGVPLGMAKVAIFATKTAPATDEPTIPATPGEATLPQAGYMGVGTGSLIPRRYNDPATSELSCEISAGENQVSFELQGK